MRVLKIRLYKPGEPRKKASATYHSGISKEDLAQVVEEWMQSKAEKGFMTINIVEKVQEAEAIAQPAV
jgi:hypothetical protein